MRRQLTALAKRAKPYVRRRSNSSSPALIVNRWSGDGKAERYGLADAARDAGIRVIMLERGDDITQLARDAIDAGADAIGAAGGDGSLGLVAGVAIERDVPFFCVPVGTRNHFALDLGLDRDNPLTALDAIRNGEESPDRLWRRRVIGRSSTTSASGSTPRRCIVTSTGRTRSRRSLEVIREMRRR